MNLTLNVDLIGEIVNHVFLAESDESRVNGVAAFGTVVVFWVMLHHGAVITCEEDNSGCVGIWPNISVVGIVEKLHVNVGKVTSIDSQTMFDIVLPNGEFKSVDIHVLNEEIPLVSIRSPKHRI